MKVTNEHYTLIKDQLSNGIDKVIEQKKVTDRKDFFTQWETHFKGNTETRKLWDLYWATGGNNWKEIAFNGNPYGGDYNDSHIGTALKKAYKELYTA